MDIKGLWQNKLIKQTKFINVQSLNEANTWFVLEIGKLAHF